MNITQKQVDNLFYQQYGNPTLEFREDCVKIQEVIKSINICLSIAECAEFWHWRSSQYDASWLSLDQPDEIIEWFCKFYNDFYDDNISP